MTAAPSTGGWTPTDLGRLDPKCEARWHGTSSAYWREGCRCPHAREAKRLRSKRSREGRTVPALADATGTRRRIQGLWALGHTSEVIALEMGGGMDRRQVERFCRQKFVTPEHRDQVATAYRSLITRQGASVRVRNRARAAGYALPVQWDHRIDDPAAEPDPIEPDERDSGDVDEVAVERALAGERVDLTDAELVAVLQAGVARGEPLSKLAERLGINYFGARKMLGGEMTPQRRKRAEVEAELRRAPDRPDSHIAALVGVHHQTVTRARARLERELSRLVAAS